MGPLVFHRREKRMFFMPRTVLLNPNQATEMCAIGLIYSINKIKRANQLVHLHHHFLKMVQSMFY